MIFALFSMFFQGKILIATWKGKKSKKMTNKSDHPQFSCDFRGQCGPGGKDYRMGGSLPKSEISSLTLR